MRYGTRIAGVTSCRCYIIVGQLRGEEPFGPEAGSGIVIVLNSSTVRGRQTATRRFASSIWLVVICGSIIARICELS